MFTKNIVLEADQEKEEYWLRAEGEPEDVLHFSNQVLKSVHRSHLCMELTVNGEPIILQSGVIVDRKYMDKEDTNKRDKQPYALKENCAYMQHNCTAYMNQKEGALVKRKMIAIGSRLYVVMDEFYVVGLHECGQYFQFPSDGTLSFSNNVVHYRGQKTCADIHYMSGNVITDSTIRMVPSTMNELDGNVRDTILITREGSALRTMVSVVYCYDRQSTTAIEIHKLVPESFKSGTMNDQQVEAFEITVGTERYIVAISHLDVLDNADLFRMGDCSGYGNALVFHASTEEKKPIRLR